MELELRGNNLYRNGFLVDFQYTDEVLLLRDPIDYVSTVKDLYHQVAKEDRLDLLAYKYYSGVVEDASKYWWVIADANNVMNPLDLEGFVGRDILIPNILTVLLKLQ